MNMIEMKRIFALIISSLLYFFPVDAQRLVDATDQSPISAASIFNAAGNLVSLTWSDGDFSDVPESVYPITICCIGYESLLEPDIRGLIEVRAGIRNLALKHDSHAMFLITRAYLYEILRGLERREGKRRELVNRVVLEARDFNGGLTRIFPALLVHLYFRRQALDSNGIPLAAKRAVTERDLCLNDFAGEGGIRISHRYALCRLCSIARQSRRLLRPSGKKAGSASRVRHTAGPSASPVPTVNP